MVDLTAARDRLIRAALRQDLYTVWPLPAGAGLLQDSLPADLACNPAELERVLYYLVDRGQVARHGAAAALGRSTGPGLYRLTVAGIDRVEGDPRFGVERARAVRMLRLRCLQALDLGRPRPMGLQLIGLALSTDADLDLGEPSLRRALTYLAECALAAVTGDAWRITAAGIDYLNGDGDQVVGIARPLGW